MESNNIKVKYLFHDITLTSVLYAFIVAVGDLFFRVSHILILPSTEQEANTQGSTGLHCIRGSHK